ncbi:hypothetical protein F5887DRAFT_1079057 [Amanita rubescens]|nr:hypothetical protein F5887DRAFT_1079057 [Amanita rubescens]
MTSTPSQVDPVYQALSGSDSNKSSNQDDREENLRSKAWSAYLSLIVHAASKEMGVPEAMIIAKWIEERGLEASIRENVVHKGEAIHAQIERATERVELRKKVEGLEALVDDLGKKVEQLIEVFRSAASSTIDTSELQM